MNKKQLIEFIPLTIFLLSGICWDFKLHYFSWIVALSGLLLGMLYFYCSFWLFSDYKISLINRIVAGVGFSEFVIASMFCFLKWPSWNIFSFIGFAILAVVIITCLFNRNSPGYKQLLYRSVFFIVILLFAYGHRRFLN